MATPHSCFNGSIEREEIDNVFLNAKAVCFTADFIRGNGHCPAFPRHCGSFAKQKYNFFFMRMYKYDFVMAKMCE